LVVYQRFHNNSQTITQFGQERPEVGLDREVGKGILGAKEKIHKRTSVSNIRFRQKNEMKVDTLDSVMGEVLSMKCKDGKWRLVAFLSKSLNKTGKNYKIHDKEMLAVIKGLENCRHLLEYAKFKFEVWTDHKNLGYL